MRELLIQRETLPEAYFEALATVYYSGDIVDCPDWDCLQRECSMTMVVKKPLSEPMISKFFIGDPRSLEQYRQEILDGILDFAIERGSLDYTYHARMKDQIPWIIAELKRNSYSRRAIISIRSEDDYKPGASPACLQSIQFFIRNSRLNCCVLFRSNDAAKATFMNAFALIFLQKQMADKLGVEMGSYTHRANSFHIYEKDWQIVRNYIKSQNIHPNEGTYNYIGEWDEMMEDSRPEIAEMIAKIKGEIK